ncbi:MAG TPA: glutamate--cysteine ligase [Mycobacteriales bacterium]|nr:glutamate--cysteine ligase [Mycobacteriales bacterium]
MGIEFCASRRNTLGVEWELQLVDVATRALRPEASAVIATLPRADTEGEHPSVKHELMESTVELVSGVCDTVDDALADLSRTLAGLRAAAAPRGIAPACAGAHPFSDWREAVPSPGERYAELLDELQWPARQIQTFGVHVHVGVTDRDKVIPVLNGITAYLPHFLALSASSPFWVGADTGLASARTLVFGALPTAGPPAPLGDWTDFEEFLVALQRAGTIRSIREVWWDVRPHPDFGTVELRVCDGLPTLREIGMVAALAQSLVHRFEVLLDRGVTLPRPAAWLVKENKWRAARHGLDAAVISDRAGCTRALRECIRELAADLAPVSAELGCSAHLATVEEVLAKGASYARQRRVVAAGGTVADVVDALLRELASDTIGV